MIRMARDDYTDYGNRGRQRGPDTFNDREWQQGGQWQYPQGQPGFQEYQGGYDQSSYGGFGGQGYQGGYGQGWSAQGGFGQGGYGQQWGGGQSGWQGREGQGVYGQGRYGQQWSAQGQGGFGEGRESWPGQSQGLGRDSSRRDYGMEPMRGHESFGGGYGSGFAGQQGSWPQGYGVQGYGQQAYGQGYGQGYGQRSMPRGKFVGRGPKGYRRSDDRIREDVNEELTRHPEIDASEIEVIVDDAEVTLVGVVEDRRAKRLAEDIAERSSGVNEVHNQLRVRHGLGEKLSKMLSGRQTGSDRESSESRSRAGRSTSSSRS
jgi:hypothetical protein